jgi:hypothetical protein
MNAEVNDLRSALESAYDNAEAGRSTENTAQPVRAEAAPTETPAAPAAPVEDRGDGRRVDGRFAPRAKPVEAAKPDVAKPVEAAKPEAAKPDEATKPDVSDRAPQSWKPGAREVWSQLPAEVRAEVHRRERETARVMQETAQARQVTDFVSKLQQKFAPALQAEGVDALTAAANLMSLSSRLRFGTPIEKAQLAATIVRTYGVDVGALAEALDGAPQGSAPAQQQAPVSDPRVDQLFQQLEAVKQQRQEQVIRRATEEVEAFGADKEFFSDVRDEMADLLEVAARRGVDLSLDQAYERACRMQPEISKVLDAREAAKRAENTNQFTQRARVAASSVRGTPATASTPSPADLRASIEAAFEQVGGR